MDWSISRNDFNLFIRFSPFYSTLSRLSTDKNKPAVRALQYIR